MFTLFNQTLKTVTHPTPSQEIHSAAPAAPMTDSEMRALKSYCQMWSYVWGWAIPGMDIINHAFVQEEFHARRSE
jgi:hypothetical protein